MANLALLVTLAAAAGEHGAQHEVEPSALGMAPGQWVALSMALLIVVMLVKGVPALIGKSLDGGINEIKKQLDEAKALRAEADKLRAEYADRIAGAEKEAAQMVEHAKAEAQAIVAKAEADTTAVIARREKMASDKIEAAELAAVNALRAKAADAAASAAKSLIGEHYSTASDKKQVDAAIAGL